MTTIRIEADDLIRKLTTLAQFRKVTAALKAGGRHIRAKIAVYPGKRHGDAIPPASEWSAKQRRGFFAKLRSGEIQVPYRRTMQLQHKWTVEARNSGMTVVVGNNAKYNRLVQDSENQTAYHKQTGWVTDDQVVREHGPTVVQYVRRAIEREIAE